jgi:hypothetical protein
MKKIIFGIMMLSNFSAPFAKDCVFEDIQNSGIGDIKHSVLGLDTFKQINGDEWVLLAGQSKYELERNDPYLRDMQDVFDYFTNNQNESVTHLPDGRGVFLRGKNLGRDRSKGHPSGDKKIGRYKRDRPKYRMKSGDPDGNQANNKTHGHGLARIQHEFREHSETSVRNVTVNTFVKTRVGCINTKVSEVLDEKSTKVKKVILDYNKMLRCDFPKGRRFSREVKFHALHNQYEKFERGERKWSLNNCLRRVIGGLRFLAEGDFPEDEKLTQEQLKKFKKLKRKYRWIKDHYNFDN